MMPNASQYLRVKLTNSFHKVTCTVYVVYTFKVLWFAQFSWIQDIVSLFSKNDVRKLWVPTDKTIQDNDTKHDNMINQTLALHETVWRVSAKSVGSNVFGNIHAGSRERCCSPSGCTEMAGPQSFKIKNQSSLGVKWKSTIIFWTALLRLFSLTLSYSFGYISEIGDAQ